MIWPLPDALAVAVSSVVWVLTCFGIGWWAARRPVEAVAHEGPVTRIRPWERDGHIWQRLLRVRRWKDRLPEAGAFFGGASKRSLTSRGTSSLERFRAETIRAEQVHWLIMATGPIHLVWCRPAVGIGMMAFGVVFDLPFIIVQRSNRGRLDALLRRRRERGRA